jgi:hypothetical protein
MINIILNNLKKAINIMKTIDNKRIRRKSIVYYMQRKINSKAVKKGIQILTESQEEKVRTEEDKQIIRFEEDLFANMSIRESA